MIYLLVFIICYLLIRIGEQDKRNGTFYYICITLAVCFLVLFAGLRDNSVGADTAAYPLEVFEFSQSEHSFVEVLAFAIIIEPLYVLLGYFATHIIANDFHVWLGICHAVIIVPIYLGAIRMKKFVSVSSFTFFFCFLFFHVTLNIQRQWMAVGIIYLGFTYLLLDRKLKTFILCLIIAFFFHKSAIFALIFIPIFYMKGKTPNRWLIAGSLFLLVAYNFVLSSAISMLGMDKYSQYASGGEWESGFSISEFLIRIVFITVLLSFKNKNHGNILYYDVITILLIEFIINMLQIWSQYMGRLGVYAYMLYLPFLSYYIKTSSAKNKKHVYYSVLFLITIGYWWLVFVEKNAGYTFPYESEVLGIK